MAKLKPKKSQSFSPKEIGIAHRLREARIRLNLSQMDVARELEISRERVASYEELRAPIRYDFALRFCWQLVFSEEWLAVGESGVILNWDKKSPGPHEWHPFRARFCMSLLFDPIFHKIAPGTAFMTAWESHLAPVYDKLSVAQFGPRIQFTGAMNDAQVKNYYHALMEWWLKDADAPLKKFRFLASLAFEAEQITNIIDSDDLTECERDHIISDGLASGKLRENPPPTEEEMESFIDGQKPHFLANFSSVFGKPPLEKRNYRLTESSLKRTIGGEVKTEIEQLITRVNKKTSVRGMRAALAKAIGVEPSRVSEWLDGKKEPSGNYALLLQKWVNGEL